MLQGVFDIWQQNKKAAEYNTILSRKLPTKDTSSNTCPRLPKKCNPYSLYRTHYKEQQDFRTRYLRLDLKAKPNNKQKRKYDDNEFPS